MKTITTFALMLSALLFTACQTLDEAPVAEASTEVTLAQRLADHSAFQQAVEMLAVESQARYQLLNEELSDAELEVLLNVEERYADYQQVLATGTKAEQLLVQKMMSNHAPEAGELLAMALEEIGLDKVNEEILKEAMVLGRSAVSPQLAANSCADFCQEQANWVYFNTFLTFYHGTGNWQGSDLQATFASANFELGCLAGCGYRG